MTGDFKILCFDDKTGEPMDVPEIIDYEYGVGTINHVMSDAAINIFIADLEEYWLKGAGLSKESYCNPKKYRFDMDIFTKFPYLYLDFCERREDFKYPIYMFEQHHKSHKLLTGLGRSLISSVYFPERELDIVTHSVEVGRGGIEIIERFINDVANNRYWKGNVPYSIAVVLLKKYRQGLYVIKDISFVNDDYMQSMRNFRPEPFIETAMDWELWSNISNILDKWSLYKSYEINHYTHIIDDIIFSNLDYARNKIFP